MAEGNIPDTDRQNSYYRIYCPEMFKTYQRKNKLFEFLLKRVEDKEKTMSSKTMPSLCNVFIWQRHNIALQCPSGF